MLRIFDPLRATILGTVVGCTLLAAAAVAEQDPAAPKAPSVPAASGSPAQEFAPNSRLGRRF